MNFVTKILWSFMLCLEKFLCLFIELWAEGWIFNVVLRLNIFHLFTELFLEIVCLGCTTSRLGFFISNLKLLFKSAKIPKQVGDLSLWGKFMGVKIFSFCKQLLLYNIFTGWKDCYLSVLIKEYPDCLFATNLKEVGVLLRSSQGWLL